ncbi:MAG: methyltransferase [Deltaproteobacteria bacterium]|nr:methyltransferase [Deltaproteobacteria bacterium]
MKKTALNFIKEEFMDIYGAVRDLSDEDILNGPEDIFRPYLERLNRLGAMDIDDHAVEEMLYDPGFESATRHISRLKRANGLKMEIQAVRSILADHDPWAQVKRFIYYPNYLQLARMEYRGANLRPKDRVVFLGSGPFPLSLICLCTQYGIEGIGIEQVPAFAELAGELIETLALASRIHIMQGNHFFLPLQQPCRLIMVGADALPKDEIFAHLAKALPNGTKLSYRIYEKGLRRLMDDQSSFEVPPEFQEYCRIRPRPPVNNTPVFLVKNSGL